MNRQVPAGEVTQLLLRWRAGDEAALASLVPLVYEELRAMARRHATAKREWAIARAWLQRELTSGDRA